MGWGKQRGHRAKCSPVCVPLTAQVNTEPSAPHLHSPQAGLLEADASFRLHGTEYPQALIPAVQLQRGYLPAWTGREKSAQYHSNPLCLPQGLLEGIPSWGSVGLQRLPIPLLSHFKLKQFPLAPLSTLSLFLFQRHLGPLNADGYTPEPVGKHL